MSIKRSVVHSLKWSAFSKFLSQIISWVSTLYIIRILTPNDYGIVAISSIFFSFITIFAVNGFISAIIKEQNRDSRIDSAIFTLSFIIYTAFGFLLILSSEIIGEFFHNTDVAIVLVATAIFLPINSFTLVPSAHLSSKMDFKTKSICESLAVLVSTLVALCAAINGLGYWSLILSNILYTFSLSVLLNYYCQIQYGFSFKFIESAKVIKFALKLQLNGLIWFLYSKVDVIIIGRAFGINLLGVYNVAQEIATLPMEKISSTLNQVGFSAFSSISKDSDASLYYLKTSLLLLSIVVFPIFFGIATIAEELILVLLTDKWKDAAILTAMLTVVSPFKMFSAVIQSYVKSIGAANFILYSTVLTAFFVISGLLLGVNYGLEYTAAGAVLGYFISFLILLYRCNKVLEIECSTLFIWVTPFIISFIMFIVSFGLVYIVGSDFNEMEMLFIKIFFGVSFVSTFYYPLYGKYLKNVFSSK
jgi:teichuronic acid exporter